MRALLLLITSLMLGVAAPASAQDAVPDARRLELAGRYLELTQGPSLNKLLTRQVEEAYAKAEMPDDQRAWLTETMSAALTQVMEATMTDLQDDVAALFTEEELIATIAFFETPIGQSIAEKSLELSITTQEVMMPHMVEALSRLGEKYCARFTCPGAGGGLIGKPGE